MALGGMGAVKRGGFGSMGAIKASTGGGSPPAGTTGQPMGLLLVLTYPS